MDSVLRVNIVVTLHACMNASNCLGKKCENTTECPHGQICCANTCVRGPSCVELKCNIGYPKCSNGESCCNNKCVKGRSCSGQSCKKNSDCGSGEKCCIETGKCVGPDECEDVSEISCRKDIDCYSATKKYYQSEMSASYNPAMIREDEPPPPYSAEQQR